MTVLAVCDGGVVVRGGRERGLGWMCHRFDGAAGARGCREKEKSESVKKKGKKWRERVVIL